MAEKTLNILKAVSEAAELLFRSPGWEQCLPAVLGLLGRSVGISRAYLFRNNGTISPGFSSFQLAEWSSAGVTAQVDNPELAPFVWQDYGLLEWIQALNDGEVVARTLSEIPVQARPHFESQEIRSLLLVPIVSGQKAWGFVGFDDCDAERKWSDSEVEALRTAANILGGAIGREEIETRLRRANERYQLAERAGGIGSWEWDIVTGALHWSDTIETMFGFAAGTFDNTYRAFLDCVHPEDLPGLLAAVRASVEEGKDYEFLHRIVCPDGTERYMQEFGDVVRDDDGTPLLMTGVVQDITEAVATQEALSEAEQRYRALVESTSDWIWEVDSHGVYTYASPKVEDLLGYTPDEVVGKTPFEMMPEAEAERVSGQFLEIVSEKKAFNHLININRHRDGREVMLETSGVPILGRDGELLGYRGIDRDITQQVRAEFALQESENLFRQFADNVREIFYVRDIAQDKMVYISSSYRQYLGEDCAPEDINLEKLLGLLHPEDRDRVISKQKYQLEGTPLNEECRIINADNDWRWIWLRTFPIYNEDGEVYRIAGLVEDITARKLAEQQRLDHERQQKEALVREVHHRIKNNLQGIVGLLRQQLGVYPELGDVVARVISQVQSISLIHGLQGESPDIFLGETVRAIGQAVVELGAGKAVLNIHVEGQDSLVLSEEEAVPVALILNELLTNAVKHGRPKEGTVELSCRIEPDVAYIRVSNSLGHAAGAGGADRRDNRGVGLTLIQALMPDEGADLQYEQDEAEYVACLTLAVPVVRSAVTLFG